MFKMKIRYRLVYNRKHKLNKNGQALVQVECMQQRKRIYLSTNVYLRPEDWDGCKVVGHPLASQMNKYLFDRLIELQRIEFEFIQRGCEPTLRMLREALENHSTPSASLRDFMQSVIGGDSSRCKNTQRSYHYLVNDLEATFGTLTVEQVDYDLITRYREAQRKKGLSENTIKGRLKALRCLMEEARKRKLIPSNPFDFITIGNIGSREGTLTASEVGRIERLSLTGLEDKVRDFFLIACYTGLRYSDISTLEEAKISGGILRKVMCKTHKEVVIPIGTLFHGKAQRIIDKYQDIRQLSHCASGTQINRILKDIATKARIDKNVYCHIGRKTFNCMLNALGMPLSDRTVLMGHSDSRVTQEFYSFNDVERVKKSVRKIFRVAHG